MKISLEEEQEVWFYNTGFSTCQLPKVDVLVTSGVLSYKNKDTGCYKDMKAKFFKAAEGVFVFNMLDDQKFTSEELIVAHNKKRS